MMFGRKIDAEKAIAIAIKNKNMPQAIHIKVISNFKAKGKSGILSYIEFASPVVTDVHIDGVEYFQVTFLEGEISFQQLSDDHKEIEIYFDDQIYDDGLAKCLINKKNGAFKYIGICDIGPRESC